jgi:hypothetical protein
VETRPVLRIFISSTAALEIRERLGHGRIEETRRALEKC